MHRAAVAAAMTRVDDDQVRIGRNVTAVRCELPTRRLRHGGRLSNLVAGVRDAATRATDAAAARILRIPNVPAADGDRQTVRRRCHRDATRAAQRERDTHRLSVVLAYA